ncbi:hypothetical protein [Thiomicrorhabdus sp. Kp2]|uniref:hypothetical protein n=1 Tax=Thiomicrorhabdus sp. Kp2 TaxID=1123518 RepID=UPI000402725D|nr:hypothetical protein [Thiomicrorhabdus sp. Kp2]
MFLKIINFFAGLFGYEWVLDSRPTEQSKHQGIDDEGWDDLYENNPRYVLRKVTRPGNFK